MTALQLAAALVSPVLIAAGVVWAVLRKIHRSAHRWQKVWALPEVVDKLTQGLSALTTGAEHTASEMRELKEMIRDRFDPPARPREHERRGGQRWP